MSGDTVRTLPNGYEYVLVHFYSSGEAKANIVRAFCPLDEAHVLTFLAASNYRIVLRTNRYCRTAHCYRGTWSLTTLGREWWTNEST